MQENIYFDTSRKLLEVQQSKIPHSKKLKRLGLIIFQYSVPIQIVVCVIGVRKRGENSRRNRGFARADDALAAPAAQHARRFAHGALEHHAKLTDFDQVS